MAKSYSIACIILLSGAALAAPPRVIQARAFESPPPPNADGSANVLPAPVFMPTPAMSVDDFACHFKPVAGTHRVTLIHPKTCCPVDVCFELPCGCAKKVTANKHSIRITYPGLLNDVVIRFKHDGGVSVRD